MENPNTWNDVMKAINRFHWDYKTISDEIAYNLINYLDGANLLTFHPHNLHSVVKLTMVNHVEDLANHICGGSFGYTLYYKLKEIGVVE